MSGWTGNIIASSAIRGIADVRARRAEAGAPRATER
jgi:hypothetical protein